MVEHGVRVIAAARAPELTHGVERVEQEVRPDLRVQRLEPGARELSLQLRELELARADLAVVAHALRDGEDRRIDEQRDVKAQRRPERPLLHEHGEPVEATCRDPVAEDDEHVGREREHRCGDDVHERVSRPARARERKPDRERDHGERHRDPRHALHERRRDRAPERDRCVPLHRRAERRLRAPDDRDQQPRRADHEHDARLTSGARRVGGWQRHGGGHIRNVCEYLRKTERDVEYGRRGSSTCGRRSVGSPSS